MRSKNSPRTTVMWKLNRNEESMKKSTKTPARVAVVVSGRDKAKAGLRNKSNQIGNIKNCETHNRGEWFLLFSTYCDIKYLLRSFTICHHLALLSLFTTIYHYLSLSVTNCQYMSLSTKVTIKQATDGIAVKKTFPKAIENQDLNDHQWVTDVKLGE